MTAPRELENGQCYQTNLSWVKDPVGELSRAGKVVMDFCAGRCFTTNTCTLVDQHRKLTGYGVNSELLSAAEPELMLGFVSRMLNPESHISASTKMVV